MTAGDSAGRPWAGRTFAASTSAYSADDGSAPAAYAAALEAFRTGRAEVEAVVGALRPERLLVPLLAGLGAAGADVHGDKEAELALVTVAGPDGRRVLPAFSSVAAMTAWDPAARPVPAPARQVALGAAADGTELVVVDPPGDGRFVLRRSALEALARDLPWTAPWRDPEVGRALRAAAAEEPAVTTVRVGAGDPAARLDGAEVLAVVVLHESPGEEAVRELLARLRRRWSEDPAVLARVDSLSVRVTGEWC